MEKLTDEQRIKDEKYLDNLEKYQYELRDLFRCDEMSLTDYREALDESDRKYREFYAELTSTKSTE